MRRILLIAFVILPIAFFVPQAFGGTEVNITSATVDSSTLTLKGINFDANGGALIVIINDAILDGCNVTYEEVSCVLTGQTTLLPGTTYTISVSAGNAPGRNDVIDAYMLDGSFGMCTTGAFTSCYTGPTGTIGTGQCQSGIDTCEGGVWQGCQGDVTPDTEICDGLDNDCDNQVDEGIEGNLCAAQAGVCSGAQEVCDGAGGFVCSAASFGPNYQAVENSCDGLDNDCDGQVDEGCQQSCNVCMENINGQCVFVAFGTDPKNECEVGSACDGAGSCGPAECVIGGVTWPSGSAGITPCQICDPQSSPLGWTNLGMGSPCGNSGETCDAAGICQLNLPQ